MGQFIIMQSVPTRDTVIEILENVNASRGMKARDVDDNPVLPIALVEERVNIKRI